MADGDNWGETLKALSAPVDAGAVKFRIQGKGSQVVPFIDARTVIARLNAVTAGEWSDEYRPGILPNWVECRLTIAGVTRADQVEINKGENGIDAAKATVSEALKRAAVKFGVGTVIYSLPKMWLPREKATLDVKEKAAWLNRPEAMDYYRSLYLNWLNTEAGKKWGSILSHGDDAQATGDYESDDATAPTETPKPRPGSAQRVTMEEVKAHVEAVLPPKIPLEVPAAEAHALGVAAGLLPEPSPEAPKVYHSKDDCPDCDRMARAGVELKKAGKLWPNRRRPNRLQCNGMGADGKYFNHDRENPDFGQTNEDEVF